MESSAQQESIALEELIKQNQEMRQQLQQEENRLPRKIENNRNEDDDQETEGS